MERNALQEHIFSTYINLRYGMAMIAGAFSLVVFAAGLYDNVPLQNSISAYYWASQSGAFVARVWFVGGLFSVAAFLYLYKGFTVAENIALNLAALLAVGVAIFPMEWNCKVDCGRFSVHGSCAVSMFVCLVYVVWFRAHDTLPFLPSGENTDASGQPLLNKYRLLYVVVGLVMLISPLTAFVLNSIIGTRTTYVFFIESAGIWAFAAYWWIKSSELKKSGATRKALRGEIET